MGDKVIAIHQPNFLPWIGYFKKMSEADIFVVLDNVQYTKNSFINRNRIKTQHGIKWLTVPVSFKFGDPILKVRINNATNWVRKHIRTLEFNYKKSSCYSSVIEIIMDSYNHNYDLLVDLNISLISNIMKYLEISTPLVKASQLQLPDELKSTELLIAIVKTLGGDVYLSGSGGKKYQDEDLFTISGIKLRYFNFVHPTYPQLWGEFVPNLSIIDFLFNVGPKARDYFVKK